jgi:molecular chaperone IbpA
MSLLTKYNSANLNQLMERIQRNAIGLDSYFDNILGTEVVNYPPYNLIAVTEDESRLELALAGFSEKEVSVYTERGKLVITGNKEDKGDVTYYHRGLAQRSFTREWTISDDTEVGKVEFVDGLLSVTLSRVVPDSHKKKYYLGDAT